MTGTLLDREKPGPTSMARPRQTRSYCVFAYAFPCTVCKTSSALLKVSYLEFLTLSSTSCGASLLWRSESTSSLVAGKFTLGRSCWSWPRSRLPRSPRLPRPMFLSLLFAFWVHKCPTHHGRSPKAQRLDLSRFLFLYSPKLVESEFSEVGLRLYGVLRSSAHGLLGHNSDSVYLHQEVRMRKARDERHRDGRRVGRLGPSVLKRGEALLQRLPLDYIDVPLDDVLWSRTASRQCRAQVGQDLLDLRYDVALTYYLA